MSETMPKRRLFQTRLNVEIKDGEIIHSFEGLQPRLTHPDPEQFDRCESMIYGYSDGENLFDIYIVGRDKDGETFRHDLIEG